MQKKYIFFKKFVIAILVLLSVLVVNFPNNANDLDNLYKYQWGLKNKGNYLVSKSLISKNHDVQEFSEIFATNCFVEDGDSVELVKNNTPLYSDTDLTYIFSKKLIDINWESAYNFFKFKKDKRDTIIALIDTGIDINHQELKESIWTNAGEIPDNGIDDDGNGYIDDVHGWNFYSNNNNIYQNKDVDIHGTHSAGTMVAAHGNGGIKGIAYDEHIKIMPIKILGEGGKGSISALIKAIEYARDNGANVVNISLGTYGKDARLEKIIRESPQIVFIVASGNGENYIGYSLDEREVYPAKYNLDNVITVGNVAFDGTRYSSSNYGSYVDVFAPGTFILSTIPNNKFGYYTGTSMAAPYVTATCAMLYSAFPKLPTTQYKNYIVNGAKKLDTLKGLAKSDGMLDILNTFLLANGY